MDMGQGDDQDPARYDTVLEDWTPDFMDNIDAPAPPQELGAPSHLVEVLAAGPETDKMVEKFIPHGSKPVRMYLKESTVPDGYERAIDHFEFDLTGSGLPHYGQGDSLGLWPTSDQEQVDLMMKATGMKGDEVLRIMPVDSNRSVPLPETLSVHTLFAEVLDVGGWPKRRFYEMLKLCATDEKEQAELAHLCSREGKGEYIACMEEAFTFAELLDKFPSARPSIGQLIDYIPDIKCRLYSIASSSRMRGENECNLCVIKNEGDATSDRPRVRASTRWLAEIESGPDGLWCHGTVHPSAVVMPDTHEPPLVMVALGTGIAPMRAFIEERAVAKKDGETCGDMALFFGARNRQEYS